MLNHTLNNEYALEGLGYTIYKDLYQLLPGHCMIIHKGSHQVEQKRWWDIRDYVQLDNSPLEKSTEEFQRLFKDACKIRLQSDVPIATALSGGLDSSAVYQTVSELLNAGNLSRTHQNSQTAVSAIFPNLPNDEKKYAKIAANHAQGSISFVETNFNNLPQEVEKQTVFSDFISGRPINSIASVYAGMQSKGIKVSMDGHGVDEMLYGYRYMVYDLYVNSLYAPNINPQPISEVLRELYHPDDKNDATLRFTKEIDEKNEREKKAVFKAKSILKKYIGFTAEDVIYSPVKLPSLSNKPYDFSAYPLKERMLYHEFFENTLPSLLRNFDRAGMMSSVEIRMPFMDWRLVVHVLSQPFHYKLGKGYTKLLLREAMKGHLHEDIRLRTFKVGIGSPYFYWLKGGLKEWSLDSLSNITLRNEVSTAIKNGTLTEALAAQTWKSINVDLIRNN